MNRMYDVFISYSRKDAHVADRICKAFDSVGITYFIDRQGIGGGSNFPKVLAEAIISSKIVLYLASRNSYESKFTQSEITFAFNRKDKGSILPYIIDNSSMPISLELVFSAINWRSMREHPIETILVGDLLQLLGKECKSCRKELHLDVSEDSNEATTHFWGDTTLKKNLLLSLIGIGAIILITLVVKLKWPFPTQVVNNPSQPSDVVTMHDDTIEKSMKSNVFEAEKKHSNGDDLLITANGISFLMKYVAPGSFYMGSSQEGSYANERPVHKVYLDEGYYIGETEVTQELWKAVMGNNPAQFQSPLYPVEQVSYIDCKHFIDSLSRVTGFDFRLPSEAEWEFAARGGVKSRKTQYSGSDTLDSIAWCGMNSKRHVHDVKSKFPNELGIYDMTGNVEEWCNDKYGETYYASTDTINPQGPNSSGYKYRVYRGGSYEGNARYSRLTNRGFDVPAYRSSNLGLRLAMSANK